MLWNPDGGHGRTTMLIEDEAKAVSSLPLDLMSRNTLTNMKKNEERIDYCVTTFSFISNRIKCIEHLTGGPFLE